MIKLKEAAQEKLYHKELLTNNLDETVFLVLQNFRINPSQKCWDDSKQK